MVTALSGNSPNRKWKLLMTATAHRSKTVGLRQRCFMTEMKQTRFPLSWRKCSYHRAECPKWHRAVTASRGPRWVLSVDTIPSLNVSSRQVQEVTHLKCICVVWNNRYVSLDRRCHFQNLRPDWRRPGTATTVYYLRSQPRMVRVETQKRQYKGSGLNRSIFDSYYFHLYVRAVFFFF